MGHLDGGHEKQGMHMMLFTLPGLKLISLAKVMARKESEELLLRLLGVGPVWLVLMSICGRLCFSVSSCCHAVSLHKCHSINKNAISSSLFRY